MLKIIWLPGFDRAPQRIDHARKVIGMDRIAGGPILQFLSRLTEILQDLAIEKFNLARRVQGTHHPWNSVDDETKAFFTLLESRLVALSIFDIGIRTEPFDNLSMRVQRRRRPEKEPTIHAIETA